MSSELNRRELLKAGAFAGALGMMLGPGALLNRASAAAVQPGNAGTPGTPKRALRLVHMTDMHIQPELRAFEGVGACLRHMQSLADKPSLILNGGDMVMDSLAQDAARTGMLWELWTRTLKDNCSVPVEHCLGNHDIWGWNKKKSGAGGDEPKWGKRWALDVLGLDKPYRTFDKSGWRFIVLDSVFPGDKPDGSYIGKLDDEQFAWFEGVLRSTPATMPVLVLTHIPILTVTAITKQARNIVEKHEVPAAKMMCDMPRIVRLFEKHRNVKACLSGHIHDIDEIDYQGVKYLCDGAVCGAWWKGRHDDCDEGYALIDLYEDGAVKRTYQTYGWKAVKE
jgi:3',5'-cyclic-AMP phosphodiesterase